MERDWVLLPRGIVDEYTGNGASQFLVVVSVSMGFGTL